jgi:hypothetical protein
MILNGYYAEARGEAEVEAKLGWDDIKWLLCRCNIKWILMLKPEVDEW